MKEHLAIYLRDHHAAGRAGLDLARRTAAGTDLPEPCRGQLRAVAEEIAEDHASLELIMGSLSVPASTVKDTLAGAAERLGRLKSNGSIVSRSPLSNVVELEGLLAGLAAKEALWKALSLIAADGNNALKGEELRVLLERAQRQRDVVESCRVIAAQRAFAHALATASPA